MNQDYKSATESVGKDSSSDQSTVGSPNTQGMTKFLNIVIVN